MHYMFNYFFNVKAMLALKVPIHTYSKILFGVYILTASLNIITSSRKISFCPLLSYRQNLMMISQYPLHRITFTYGKKKIHLKSFNFWWKVKKNIKYTLINAVVQNTKHNPLHELCFCCQDYVFVAMIAFLCFCCKDCTLLALSLLNCLSDEAYILHTRSLICVYWGNKIFEVLIVLCDKCKVQSIQNASSLYRG